MAGKRLLALLLCIVLLASCRTAGNAADTRSTGAAALAEASKFIEAENWEAALPIYERALSSNLFKEVEYNRILCLLHLNRFEEAVTLLSLAKENYPDTIVFHNMEVSLYEAMEDTDALIAALVSLLERDPYNAESSLRLLNLYIETGDFENAEKTALILIGQGLNTKEAGDFLFYLNSEQ